MLSEDSPPDAVSFPLPDPDSTITVDNYSKDDTCALVRELAHRVASTTSTVLILGECGTGKSALARALHNASPRHARPFRTVSCPSLSEELFESELFGHVRGAFTDAVKDKWGKVKAAEGGTLFLDEIGELPLSIQPKLLRLLEDREYERVGETATHRADVRIIAATNRNILALVRAGTFREDLFYRLSVIDLPLPPLRRRPTDLSLAAERFRREACETNGIDKPFSPKALEWIQGFSWPGNFRELKNSIERAVILSCGPCIYVEDLESLYQIPAGPPAETLDPDDLTLKTLRERHIRAILGITESLEEAAEILGVHASTLYRHRLREEGAGR